jgi:hypothetical protein
VFLKYIFQYDTNQQNHKNQKPKLAPNAARAMPEACFLYFGLLNTVMFGNLFSLIRSWGVDP